MWRLRGKGEAKSLLSVNSQSNLPMQIRMDRAFSRPPPPPSSVQINRIALLAESTRARFRLIVIISFTDDSIGLFLDSSKRSCLLVAAFDPRTG